MADRSENEVRKQRIREAFQDKKIVVDYENLNEINLPLNEYFILVVFKNNVKYDFVINFKENSEKLLVLGSGLIPRDFNVISAYFNKLLKILKSISSWNSSKDMELL